MERNERLEILQDVSSFGYSGFGIVIQERKANCCIVIVKFDYKLKFDRNEIEILICDMISVRYIKRFVKSFEGTRVTGQNVLPSIITNIEKRSNVACVRSDSRRSFNVRSVATLSSSNSSDKANSTSNKLR